jgi:hypothetical protein
MGFDPTDPLIPHRPLYACDEFGHRIIRIDEKADSVTVIAGAVSGRLSCADYVDGVGTAARFSFPCDMCFTARGELLIADHSNSSIRRAVRKRRLATASADSKADVDAGEGDEWHVTTAAGFNSLKGHGDGPLLSPLLSRPRAVVLGDRGAGGVNGGGDNGGGDVAFVLSHFAILRIDFAVGTVTALLH